MNYQSESEVQRMKELIGYGINEQTVNTGGSKPIVEYKMKAADGKTYGIIHECNKFYIKVAPKKDTEVLAEDFDYIGGWNNRKENEYKTYAMASKQFDLKMMSINEANTHKVEIQQFKPVESSEWQINETKEMRSELERFRQITNNVAVILKEDKNVLPAEHTLPEAPASNPSKDKVNSPFTDTAVANGDKDTKQTSTDPKKEGQPYDNETKVTDNDMQSDKKPNGDGKDDTYSEKAKYVPDNSVADKKPSGGKVAKVDESQRRTFKLTEEQVLAWSKSKDYLDTSKGTEIGDKSPYTETPSDVNEENAVHNTDNQNVPTPGNGEIGDDSPFTEKVNEDSANVDDVAGMPSNDDDDDTDDVPFPEVEDGGAYLDFEKDNIARLCYTCGRSTNTFDIRFSSSFIRHLVAPYIFHIILYSEDKFRRSIYINSATARLLTWERERTIIRMCFAARDLSTPLSRLHVSMPMPVPQPTIRSTKTCYTPRPVTITPSA